MEKISKEQLINEVASRHNITKTAAQASVNQVISTIKELVHEDKEVNLVGFCKWFSTVTKAKEGRNPFTGEKMKIESKKVYKAKISPNF